MRLCDHCADPITITEDRIVFEVTDPKGSQWITVRKFSFCPDCQGQAIDFFTAGAEILDKQLRSEATYR